MNAINAFYAAMNQGQRAGAAMGNGLASAADSRAKAQERKQEDEERQAIANKLATSDYDGASQEAFNQGRIEIGLQLRRQMQEAQRQGDESTRGAIGAYTEDLTRILGNTDDPDLFGQASTMALMQRAREYGISPEAVQELAPAFSDMSVARAYLSQPEEAYTLSDGAQRYRGENLVAENTRDKSGASSRVTIGPDGAIEVTSDPLKLSAEARSRATVASPIIGSVVDELEALFKDETGAWANPLNSSRNRTAAGTAIVPGGDTLARDIGGDTYQAIETRRKQAEALILPMQSGLAVTVQEAQRFVRAGLPQTADSPQNIERKLQYLRSLDYVTDAALRGEVTPQQAKAQVARLFAGVEIDAGGPGTSAPEIPLVASQEEYDSLPSGAVFMDDEGNRRRKP